jgi:Na+/H+-dicarboxylate symporter
MNFCRLPWSIDLNTIKPANLANPDKSKLTIAIISRYLNKPQVTLGAIAIAIALGMSGLPLVETLRPVGELYLALLQMSVLPFLLAAIPLAMRSAIAQGAAGRMLVRVIIWLGLSIILVATVGILLSAIGWSPGR